MTTSARTLFASVERPVRAFVPLRTGGASGFAAPGPGKPVSEDAMLVVSLTDDRCVLAVADGLGGLPGAAEAARLAVACLAEAVEGGAAAGAGLRTAILDGFEAANRRILASGTGGATTLACAAIEDGTVRAFHVGDSEVLLLGQRHRLRMRTVPHSPTGFAVEAGFLDDDTALAHEERHIVSNVMGSRDMRIDIGSPIPLRPLDTLLVGSDGLMDNLRTEEIASLICTGPLGTAVARTAAAARERMTREQAGEPSKPDDLTLLAYRQRPGKGFRAVAARQSA